jgi:hypothetical protein|tara:strand:+ start:1257 stop:1670 length:414 start_codon:yes stop_codon:yes gene_type:complete
MPKKNSNRNARSVGGKAEALLLSQLSQSGYEARRTHLSAFPDIIAWKGKQFLLIEVKARTVNGELVNEAAVINNTLSAFRSDAKKLKESPISNVLCFIRIQKPYHDYWRAYLWKDKQTREVDIEAYIPSVVQKELIA